MVDFLNKTELSFSELIGFSSNINEACQCRDCDCCTGNCDCNCNCDCDQCDCICDCR